MIDTIISDKRDLARTIEWLRSRSQARAGRGRLAKRPVIVAGMGDRRLSGNHDMKVKIPCPLCGGPMMPDSVMCAGCFRATRKERGVGVW